MKVHPSLGPCLLALTVGLAVVPAWADDDCDAPVERWQSRDAVGQMAARRGWDIQRLKIDDGCYELRGRDAEGRSFKARLDPETLEVLKWKGGARDRDHDRDHDRDRDHDQDRERARSQIHHPPQEGAGNRSGAPLTPQPLFAPGSAPRGQIE
jgi:hypothetical protein